MPGGGRPFRGLPGQRIRKGLQVVAVLATLCGCGSGAVLDSFDLSAATAVRVSRAPRGQLVVSEPVATSPTDSDRIVVRPTPDTVATLKGAQWIERLPRLLQTRLVQTFENARMLRSVGRPDTKIQADTSLSSEIRRFEIDVTSGEAVVEISIKLVSERNGRIIAARIFIARTAGSASDGGNATAALDSALGQVLRQIVAWSAASV